VRTDVHDSQRTCEALLNADTRVSPWSLVSCSGLLLCSTEYYHQEHCAMSRSTIAL
jgi:hypothetical protein